MEFFAGIGAGWMNLASLALGLLAWMLPVAAMIRTAARPRALHPALPLVCVSFAACAAALYLQLRYHAHLSRIEDVGAFLDTAQAAAFASAVLLCVTLALNALALCAAARKNGGQGSGRWLCQRFFLGAAGRFLVFAFPAVLPRP